MLARQAILDCQFLDQAAADCAPLLLTAPTTPTAASTAAATAAAPPAHAAAFAAAVLAVLEAHSASAFRRRLRGLLGVLAKHAAQVVE